MENDKYIFWKDIDIWLRKNSFGDITDQENTQAILNSVYNILSTQPGDRRMLPEFACDIRGLLFEPIDNITASKISQRILGALEVWEPRIKVTSSNVHADIDNAVYNIYLSFEILKSNEQVTLNFPIKKI